MKKFITITSLVAAAAMTSTAFGAGNADTILINFASGNGSNTYNVTDTTNGTWNNLTGASSSTAQSLTAADGTTTGAGTIAWASKNTWEYTSNVTDEMLKGYLDDGNGITINVTTNFLVADVTVYCATDSKNATFSAKTVNGSTYTYDSGTSKTVLGSGSWGTAKTATPVEGTNALTISGVSAGSISIASAANSSGQGVRGCIAGLKIVDTGVKVATTILTDATWTNESLAGTTWTNVTDTNKTYAGITISGTVNLNITGDAVTAIGVLVDGTGTLTLSGNELKLISAGVIKTGSDSASLLINNTLNFTNGGTITGNVTFGDNASLTVGENKTLVLSNGALSGAATLVLTTLNRGSKISFDASSATSVDLSKLKGSETSRVAIKASGTADSFTTISNLSSFFTGTLEITGGYLKVDSGDAVSKLSNAKIVLSGGSGSGLVFLRASKLTFGKDIVAEGVGGELRSYGADNYSVNFTGKVSGTTISHVDGGTHTFSGEVDLETFNANAGVSNFERTTKIGTLNVNAGTTNLSGTSTITSLRNENGTLNITGKTNVTNFQIKQGAVTISSVLNVSGSGNNTVINSASFGLNNSNTTTMTIQDGGVVNVKNAHISVRDGTATLNVQTGGELNFDKGLNTTKNGNWGGAILNLDGGRINIGSGGIQRPNYSVVKYNFNSGTIGSLADTWASSEALTLGGAITIDTAKKNLNDNGKATDAGTGSTITLNGIVSGAGSLEKVGAGTLNLNAANTYTGGTTISAGMLVAANASALGTGKVTVENNAKLGLVAGTTVANVTNGIELNTGAKFLIDLTGQTATGETLTLNLVTGTAITLNGVVVTGTISSDWYELTGWDKLGWTSTLTYADNTLKLSMAIPEPSMFGLLAGLGALALVGTRRRRKTK